MPFRSEVTSDRESDAEVLDHEDGFDGEYGEFFDDLDFAALGVDPNTPTEAKPGSEDKQTQLPGLEASAATGIVVGIEFAKALRRFVLEAGEVALPD